MKVNAWLLPLAALLGAVLPSVLCRPAPVGPSVDSLAIMREVDSLRGLLLTAEAGLVLSQATGAKADSQNLHVQHLIAHRPVIGPKPATLDSAEARYVDSLHAALEYEKINTEKAVEAAATMRAAYIGAATAANQYAAAAAWAEGRLSQAAATAGRLNRARNRRDWEVGVVWEPGTTAPVGGWVGKDVGERVVLRIEATDGPKEPATVRLGGGIRF